mmetsp:Transcript_9214/g.33146  ORF Transcript_9214/g.33146 Transcript_9214/m.33146 type:complete len:626 (-) Transcript_9214:330-2207(-)
MWFGRMVLAWSTLAWYWSIRAWPCSFLQVLCWYTPLRSSRSKSMQDLRRKAERGRGKDEEPGVRTRFFSCPLGGVSSWSHLERDVVQPLQGDVVPLVHHDRGINGVDVLVDLVLMPPLVPGREEPEGLLEAGDVRERHGRPQPPLRSVLGGWAVDVGTAFEGVGPQHAVDEDVGEPGARPHHRELGVLDRVDRHLHVPLAVIPEEQEIVLWVELHVLDHVLVLLVRDLLPHDPIVDVHALGELAGEAHDGGLGSRDERPGQQRGHGVKVSLLLELDELAVHHGLEESLCGLDPRPGAQHHQRVVLEGAPVRRPVAAKGSRGRHVHGRDGPPRLGRQLLEGRFQRLVPVALHRGLTERGAPHQVAAGGRLLLALVAPTWLSVVALRSPRVAHQHVLPRRVETPPRRGGRREGGREVGRGGGGGGGIQAARHGRGLRERVELRQRGLRTDGDLLVQGEDPGVEGVRGVGPVAARRELAARAPHRVVQVGDDLDPRLGLGPGGPGLSGRRDGVCPPHVGGLPLDVLQDLVPQVLAADDVELLVDQVEEILPRPAAVDGVLQHGELEPLGRVKNLPHELRPKVEVYDVLVSPRGVELLQELGLAPNRDLRKTISHHAHRLHRAQLNEDA